MIEVSALHVYPIKSARGIALASAEVGDRGFHHDRRFLVVDGDGRFLTQRELPRLALLATAIEREALRLDGPGMTTLRVPLSPLTGGIREVTVWRDRCSAIALGDEAAGWLTRYLGRPCELVHMPDPSVRLVDPAYGRGARVGFADGYPFLILSEASVEELGRRGAPLPMNRFRPNLVVRGCAPFAEDRWRTFRIGEVRFHGVKPCERCSITTVDQERGEVAGPEPLRALAGFRRQGSGVIFGQNLIHEGRGAIRVGDEVIVEESATD